ncbi:COX15/CtaA family protein [Saccharibacillus sp. CPCC 101409]|uniref:COX15/CtaA family protein n=1 Tax=Saccharibacillus sp. CPCC 101409 TaxID=3058041 RepID=UPI002670FCC2|nr:COX15/CtaA family protein [Saccharibacillus sp. CPCC 101409]MDO3411016.1 COX15/CtaA family protein [Saccharibacillus sp. CPCC 101409]
MQYKVLKWLSYASCLIMLLVSFNGVVVTRTGSGLECGREFPLCHGKFVPGTTIGSLIEYTHRLTAGVAGLLALATLIAFLVWSRKRRDFQIYAGVMFLFVVVQAIMGALAVVFSQVPAIMALHFGFALIAFASALVLALSVRRAGSLERYEAPPAEHRISKRTRNLTVFSAAFTYAVVYTGALVSHTELAKAAVVLHIASALLLVLVLMVGHMAVRGYGHIPDIRKLGIIVVALIIALPLSGVVNLVSLGSEYYMFAPMLHTLITDFLFAFLCFMSIRTWELSRIPAGEAAASRRVKEAVRV